MQTIQDAQVEKNDELSQKTIDFAKSTVRKSTQVNVEKRTCIAHPRRSIVTFQCNLFYNI